MILADTSVWVDHLRAGDPALATLLDAGRILAHPWVIAEIALGSLSNREAVLDLLDSLPHAPTASIDEIRLVIAERALFSRGVGLVDVGLLAGCLLAPGSRLWTKDKRLGAVAGELSLAFDPAH